MRRTSIAPVLEMELTPSSLNVLIQQTSHKELSLIATTTSLFGSISAAALYSRYQAMKSSNLSTAVCFLLDPILSVHNSTITF